MDEQKEKMPLGKALITTVIVIIAVAAIVAIIMFLKIPMWIPLLGLTVWSTIGMPMDMKSVCKVWASASAALVMGYMLGHADTLGVVAFVIAAIGIFFLIFGIVSGRLSFLFNMITAIFLTTCTAEGVVLDAVPAIKGLVFGFVVFGLVPGLIAGSMAKKKTSQTE